VLDIFAHCGIIHMLRRGEVNLVLRSTVPLGVPLKSQLVARDGEACGCNEPKSHSLKIPRRIRVKLLITLGRSGYCRKVCGISFLSVRNRKLGIDGLVSREAE